MNVFKSKRAQFNVTLEEVSKKIFISPHVLKDLEEGNYEAILHPFVYYCAKDYAKFLGIELPNNIKKIEPRNG